MIRAYLSLILFFAWAVSASAASALPENLPPEAQQYLEQRGKIEIGDLLERAKERLGVDSNEALLGKMKEQFGGAAAQPAETAQGREIAGEAGGLSGEMLFMLAMMALFLLATGMAFLSYRSRRRYHR